MSHFLNCACELLVALALVILPLKVCAFSWGAPIAACVGMVPTDFPPQTSQFPYIVNITNRFCPDGNIKVMLTSDPHGSHPFFKGYFFEAREPGSVIPIGSWALHDPANQRFINCTSNTSAVSHNNHNLRNFTMATWTAPFDYNFSTVNILVSVVETLGVFWPPQTYSAINMAIKNNVEPPYRCWACSEVLRLFNLF